MRGAPPGAYGCTATNEGKGHNLIGFLSSEAIRRGTDGWVNHAFIVVPGGRIVEMEGRGAQIAPLTKYPTAVFNDEEVATIPPAVLAKVVEYSLGLVPVSAGGIRQSDKSIGYSYPGIVAIGLASVGFANVGGWLQRKLANGSDMFCSQAVDAAYAYAGYQLFDDHRLPGAVRPVDLERRIAERVWQK